MLKDEPNRFGLLATYRQTDQLVKIIGHRQTALPMIKAIWSCTTNPQLRVYQYESCCAAMKQLMQELKFLVVDEEAVMLKYVRF